MNDLFWSLISDDCMVDILLYIGYVGLMSTHKYCRVFVHAASFQLGQVSHL